MEKEKYNWWNPAAYVFIAFCGFIMALNASNKPIHVGNTGTDSSVFNYVARVIIRGGMPYRDTFDHKGPLIYLIDAFGLLINEQIGVWLMELITILIAFLFTYKIARLVGCNQLASCAVVAVNVLTLSYYFEGGNLVEEYGCAFITISLYIFLKFFISGKVKSIDLIICGASFAAVCLLRINMIALWVVMCIGVLIDRLKQGKAKEIIGFVFWFLIGAVIIAAPIMIWLIVNDAFQPFIEDYFLFNFMYSSDADRASTTNIIKAILIFSCGAPMIIGAPSMLYYCIHGRKLIDCLAFCSLVFSLLMMCISGQTYGHYGMILCPIISYAVAKMPYGLTALVKPWKVEKTVAFSLSLAVAFILLFSRAEFVLAKSVVKAALRYNPPTDIHSIVAIVKDNTDSDDTISVCGNRDIIYLLSDRQSVSKYSYQSPIAKVNPHIMQEYLADIRGKEAKMIIIDEGSFLYSDISPILEESYHLISTIGETNLYLRAITG